MDQDKKIRWGFIIVVLFFLSLAVDYFFLHILFQAKIQEQQKQERVLPETGQPKTQLPQTPSPSPSAATRETSPSSVPSLAGFQEKATQCLGSELGKSASLDELISALEKNNPVARNELQLENTHIQLPDGSERRLHLIPADNTNHKNAFELRYFKLDSEGLPERIPLPADKSLNPKPAYLESLKKQGSVIYHQTKNTKTLKDGASMVLTTINNKVYEFQIFNHGKTLSCREFNCACK